MEQVSVESIDYHDRSFCISYPVLHDRLIESIKQFGILSPLIVLGPAPFRLVTGFRRLEAARQLGLTEIPCFIDDLGAPGALLLAIHDNIPRSLNLVEKALCVEKIIRVGIEQEQREAIMKTLGLQPHERTTNLLLSLAQSEEELKTFVAGHNVAIHELGLLLSFPGEVRSRLIASLAPIHLTSSLLREIIELARLLFIKKETVPFESIAGLTNGDEIKVILKRETYPLLTDLEDRLKAIKGAVGLPLHISILTDPYFERSDLEIRIKARDEGEVRDSVNKLQRITDNGQVRSIFDLIGGKPTHS
jgi:ParB/RepB/Spo0J family partition protein